MKMKIYNKGQVVIPASIRKKYNLNIGDYVDVVVEDDNIRLIPTKKSKVTDELFGILNEKEFDCPQISENEITKVTEEEFVNGWKQDESN